MLAALLLAVAISPSPGQHLEFSTVLPDSLGSLYDPTDIIINPVSGNCWVASSGGLLVFDPVTRARVRRLEAYGTLVVCPDAGKGYAVAPEGLTVLDLGADTVLGRVELPADAEYLSAAWSRTTNRLYVAANHDDEWDHVVRVLDIATDEWVAEVPFEDWLTAPVWDPVLDRVLVGVDRYTGDSSCLAAIDCGPDTLVAFAPVLDAGFLTLALNPGGRKAYCTGVPVTGWPVTGVVDVDSYAVIGALAGARGLAVIYNPVVDRAYCASGDTVQIFDGRTDSLRAEVGLAGSVYIYDPMDYRPGLAASPRTGRVYAAFEWPVGVAVIDTFDVARTAAVLPESSRMRGGRVCASPLADVVVSALFRDTVLVVDGAADTLAGALEYWYISVRSLVHNPAGNKLYAADPTADLLLVLGSDLALLGRIPLADFDPDAALVVNPALNRLYLVDDYRLQVVDCNTDRLIATLAVPAVEEARLVLYPPLGRLYVFAANGTPPVYVYDCLRNEIVGSVEVNGEVPCAVYHPRSDRIYFACKTPPNFRVLDPRTDSITDTLRLGADVSRGKMLANTEQDVVYFANDRSGRLYTFDVRSGTATDSVPLAFAPDTLFWNRRHGRLYIVRESGSNNLQVLDCRTGELSEPRSVEYEKAGVMDERYDKLYFGGSGDYRTAVIDCRTDSVEYLPFAGLYPRAMAWNPIDSRVYAVRINRFSVYRQDAPGIAGESPRVLRRPDATVIRATLRLAGREPASLLDITGRKVMELLPGANDVRHLAPGVYFVRATGSGRTAPGVTKVVVQR
jgi:DNA-binding beta-propeller fold protein YncE